jgi:hypothetical protein
MQVFSSCTNKKTEITSPPLADYLKPNIGKYIIYRLDSTVTAPFGTALVVRSYRIKDSIDAQITDGLGRAAYRVVRTITDTNGVAPYKANATYYTVPVGTSWVETVNNNLRYVSLRWPILNDFEWKGNSFINTTSPISDVLYLDNWNYTYKNVGQPYTVFNKKFDNTLTVAQRDESDPPGPFVDTAYKQRNFSVEVYAKNVGLIYKDFLHYIYQNKTSTRNAYYEDNSYGIRLRVIDFN